jgi:hypothetical protein
MHSLRARPQTMQRSRGTKTSRECLAPTLCTLKQKTPPPRDEAATACARGTTLMRRGPAVTASASAIAAVPRPATRTPSRALGGMCGVSWAGLTLRPDNGRQSGMAYWGICFPPFSHAALRPFSAVPQRRLSTWARLSVASEQHVLVLFAAGVATASRRLFGQVAIATASRALGGTASRPLLGEPVHRLSSILLTSRVLSSVHGAQPGLLQSQGGLRKSRARAACGCVHGGLDGRVGAAAGTHMQVCSTHRR